MQKNGSLVISRQEMSSIQNGVLPKRVALNWDLTLDEIQKKIQAGELSIMDDTQEGPDKEDDGMGF